MTGWHEVQTMILTRRPGFGPPTAPPPARYEKGRMGPSDVHRVDPARPACNSPKAPIRHDVRLARMKMFSLRYCGSKESARATIEQAEKSPRPRP